MSTTLRLSELLGRGVGVEWFEAVALVQVVAERVRDTGGRGVPELDQVMLASDGTVSMVGVAATDEPVRRLGQLLQACLAQSDPPVQLRLVVAQATAPEPGYHSIRDYIEALVYFERPDRIGTLASLCARAQAAPATDGELPTLDRIAPLQPPDPPRKGARSTFTPGWPSRRAVLIIAAMVLLVVTATAYTQFSAAAPSRPDVSTAAAKATDAVGATLVKGLSAVSEAVGLGRLVPADSPHTAPPPPPGVTTEPTQKTKRAASPRPALRIFDLDAQAPISGMPVGAVTADIPLPGLPMAPASLPTTADLADGTIYSASDSSVIPPVGVRPQLPRVLPDGIGRDRLSQIELLIQPDGRVGSVKLLGPGRGVLEGMLLSAAKAWTFKPAEKGGRPVAYRKTVWLIRD